MMVALITFADVALAVQDAAGSIRGMVLDADFDAPLRGAQVLIVETGQRAETNGTGNYAFGQVEPGRYTLVISKAGFVREVETGVVVLPGQFTDADAELSGEFTDMDEFVVQDVLIGGGSEQALLDLRFESPSLVDSIGSDLMSRAGASDAASALTLVSGATVQDGKFAVIRGLPDRYVSSQLNGVRLPTSDEDKRAVELDQFPAPVIESIQVTKTFTPDQQGDASGGAVDVRLASVPEETILEFKAEYGANSQLFGIDDFLTYEGGGVGAFGFDDARKIQPTPGDWSGAVGVKEGDAPQEYKFSLAVGDKQELSDGVFVGGFASLFYQRDASFYDNGISDDYWITSPGDAPEPVKSQVDASDDFKTSLFDVREGSQSVTWGGLGTIGLESEDHELGLTYLYTRLAEDTATLAENTRGKEFFFPDYDPNDVDTNTDPEASPYLRTQTLVYEERETQSLQLRGEHAFPFDDLGLDDSWFTALELDWTASLSSASLDQPDKRQFGVLWKSAIFDPGNPVFGIPPSTDPAEYEQFKPSANINLGNLQRIFKTIDEESQQLSASAKLPFEQWGGEEGYLESGVFLDRLQREFRQDSFANPGDSGSYVGEFDQFWSDVWESETHTISDSPYDVDYDGEIDITAYYAMIDLPLDERWSVIGGARVETTDITVVNDPDQFAQWFPPGSITPVALTPGDGDVDQSQTDVLPALGVIYKVDDDWTVRAAYSQTIGRQTFKELVPIIQQEFLGGPIFIGNPDLEITGLQNYDLRVDYRPNDDTLVSVSGFYKDVENPIEYVQRVVGLTFTQPVNYSDGELYGVEFELRQGLGRYWESLEGLSLGGNVTLIESAVTLTEQEQIDFADPDIQQAATERDMTNAPEHLYNLYLTYDLLATGTELSLFYTVKGDTLVAGAAVTANNFVPSVYETEYGTLNFSLSQRLGDNAKLSFKAKNLLDPEIESVYRADGIEDTVRTSYTKGISFSLGITIAL